MQKTLFITAALSFLLTSAYAAAIVDQSLFGPKRYERLKSKPTVYTDTFKGCGVNGKGLLRIANGDNDRTGITSAEIYMNGVVVADEHDFKKHDRSIEKSIMLRESNTIMVKLKSGRSDEDDERDDRGGKGERKDKDRKNNDKEHGRNHDKDRDRRASFITIEVIGQECGASDGTPPVISNPQPVGNALLANPTPVISAQYADEAGGTGIDAASAKLIVDGADVTSASAITSSGISYTPASNLPEGSHTATITVSDLARNSAGLTWHFTTDTVAPVIQITEPQAEAYLNTSSITITGTLTEPVASVTVNNMPAVVTGTGFSFLNFILAEGVNYISVRAIDQAGNSGLANVNITRDSTAPSAPVISQPLSPSPTLVIIVSGTAEAGSFVTLSMQTGQGAASIVGTATATSQGTFSIASITLAEGSSTFTAIAADAVGNTSPVSAPISVTRDTNSPEITVSSPSNNSFTNQSTISVIGALSEPGTLSMNGAMVELDGLNFSHSVSVTSSTNFIVITAKDLSGNTATLNWVVYLDQILPVVSISAPVSGFLTRTSQVAVSGSVSETPTSVTVNGVAAVIMNKNFSLANAALVEGQNILVVEATDRAGNVGTTSVNVVLDTQAPAVTISAPSQAAAGLNISISAGASDNSNLNVVELFVNSVAVWSFNPQSAIANPQSISYSVSPDLTANTVLTIQASAVDTAGNIGTTSTQIQITSGAAGPGYIQGEVFDDTKGQLLAGVGAVFAANGRESSRMTAGEDGGYFIETPADAYLITLSKPGFTSVDRRVTVKPEKDTVAVDARLTPVSSQQNIIDAIGGTVKTGFGGQGSGVGNSNIELVVPADALSEQADIRVTHISNQGLMGLLPMGWSPISVVDVTTAGSGGQGPGSGLNFSIPAILKVPLLSGAAIPGAQLVTLVSYDIVNHQWIVLAPGAISSDSALITAFIFATGQYAFVLPDDAATPTQGSALPSLNTEFSTLNSSITATGRVVPAVAPAAIGLKAVGEVTIIPSPLAGEGGGEGSLHSGTIVSAEVIERFDLLSGEVVLPNNYTQDLVLYKYPCLTNVTASQISSASSAVKTVFPITPSREYTIIDLMIGKIHLEIYSRESDRTSGTMVGIEGARLLDKDGNVLVVPQNGLTKTVPIETKTVPASSLTGVVGSDFTLLRAVDINLSNQTLTGSAELSIPAPTNVSASLPIVVARAIEIKGVRKLKLVALARLSGSLITSGLNGLSGLNGISTSGTYLFLQAKSQLGFVTGTVKDGAAKAYASAQVASNTCSLVDLTSADGKYLVASTVANFSVTGTDIYKNDKGTRIDTITAVNQTKALDITINVTPPYIVSVSPADAAQGVDPKTQIVITMSEAVKPESVTSNSVILEDATGTRAQGVFSLSPDNTVITLYPENNFMSETQYTLTVSHSIQDMQGYFMGQDVVSHFTIKDTTPPPMPAAGSIVSSFPDADGYVTITATQGSAEATGTVLIINDTSGEIVSVTPASNGSFSGKIMAQLGDEIRILSMDSSGNQTLITYITFKSDDGKYLVTAKGGTVEGPGGLKLEIPEGALMGPTVIKLMPVDEDQLAQDNPLPSQAKFIGAVNIDTGGMMFNKEVKLSVPKPWTMPSDAEPFVSQPQVLTNADGTEEKVYVIVDSAKIVTTTDGKRITTASPPFDGVMTPGIFVFAFMPAPLAGPVVISGYTYRDMDDIPGYLPGASNTSDKPVSGAVIRSPGSWNFISFSKADGHYATYGFTARDTCRNFAITAIHPQTMYKWTANITACDEPYSISNQNFRLADKNTQIPDKTKPLISMNMQVLFGQGPDARFVAGTVPVGVELEMPISIIDQEMGTATIKLSFKTPDMIGDQSHGVTLQKTDQTIYTYITTTAPVAINKYVYTPGFSFPIAGSQGRYFRPDKAGTYAFTLEAMDAAGNMSSRSMTVRAVEPGTQPDGVDGPPQVDEIIPSNDATDIMVTMPVTATFNEPVSNVTSATFKLFDLGPADLATDATFTIAEVSASVATLLEGNRVRAVLTPGNNLMFNRKYKAVLSREITDSVPNSAAVCAAQTPTQSPDCLLKLDKEYASIFTTKVPQVYDLTDGTFQEGRDIALYISNDGATYAYVTAGSKGWYVIDVSDPTQPEIVKEHLPINSLWSYRNLSVDQESNILGMTEFGGESHFGYVRFYDLTNEPQGVPPTTPADPKVVARERIAEAYSGIPGRLSIRDNFAYIATVGTGLQVVDIKAAIDFKKNQPTKEANGSSIVGIYDTIGQGYSEPTDIEAYKSGRAALTTTSGHLIMLDLTIPQFPQEMTVFKPAMPNTYNYDSAWRVAVASEYVYTLSPLEGEGEKTIDIAVTVSRQGRIHTIDITDPFNPAVMGVTKDGSGTELAIQSTMDIAISKSSGLAYIAAGNAVYVIDIKNPKNPLLLNIIAQTPEEPGSGVLAQLGYSNAVVELGGWVYLANQQKGMRVLDLDPYMIKLLDANDVGVDEIRYSDGTKDERKYQIRLDANSAIIAECMKLTGTLSVLDKNNSVYQPAGATVSEEYQLSFQQALFSRDCLVTIKDHRDSGNSTPKPYFHLSNRDELAVRPESARISAGLSGRMLRINVKSSLLGWLSEIKPVFRPIEPVGVVVLAIDGLRQDVLYPSAEQKVYPTGVSSPYYVHPTELTGLCEVLGGKRNSSGLRNCDDQKMATKHIKLSDVTTIFPSITFAAWASIYSGKPPKETGILGNEFFARDLISMGPIIGLNNLPPGMVTLDPDGGAFRPEVERLGYSSASASLPSILTHIMPAEFWDYGYDTMNEKLNQSTPQALIKSPLVWTDVNTLVRSSYKRRVSGTDLQFAKCSESNNECRTVSFFNQYPGMVDWWGTPTNRVRELWRAGTSMGDGWSAETMDKSSATEAVNFINDYFDKKNTVGKRKRFPALFSVYLSGLDHYAHVNGMGGYKDYFTGTLDTQIMSIVQALKDNDEFESKIFIVVSDHGETEMPEGLTYIRRTLITDEDGRPYLDSSGKKKYQNTVLPVDMSCSLKTAYFDNENVREREKRNNSLHIWELGELFRITGKENRNDSSWWFKVLAPNDIADLNKSRDKVTKEARGLPYGATGSKEDVLVAMNGPMAHIYVNDLARMGTVAEILRLSFGNQPLEAAKWWGMDSLDYADYREKAAGRLKDAIDMILVRRQRTGDQSEYCIFDGRNDDGSAKCAAEDSFSNQSYVKAWERIKNMNHEARSGDIVLLMKDSSSGSATGRYSTGYACKAWHGSLNESDSYVPFVVAYPGGSKSVVENVLQEEAICKTGYQACVDNWKMPVAINGILQKQY